MSWIPVCQCICLLVWTTETLSFCGAGTVCGCCFWECPAGWWQGRSVWISVFLHCKKWLAIFPSPAGMSLTKLSLAGNNQITVFPAWENLVSDIPARDRKIANLFLQCIWNYIKSMEPSVLVWRCLFWEPGCWEAAEVGGCSPGAPSRAAGHLAAA